MEVISKKLTLFKIEYMQTQFKDDMTPYIDTFETIEIYATSMNRTFARGLYMDKHGERLSNGALIKWEELETATYLMPLDVFIKNAVQK